MSLVITMLVKAAIASGLLLSSVGYASLAEAGAWLRSEGSALLTTSFNTSSSQASWDDNRKRKSEPCTTERHTLGVHGEYGYSYHHTVFASADISNKRCSDERTVQGLSDLTVGVRGRLDPFRNGRSWELALRLPISGTSADPERPGNGEFGLDAGVHIRMLPDPYDHARLRQRQGVWSWGTGVRLWSGGLAQQGWAYGGWGRDLNDVWSFSARLSGTMSFGGSSTGSGVDRRRRNDYDKLTASVSLQRSLTQDLGISFGLSQDLAGRNADQATSFRVSISRSWR